MTNNSQQKNNPASAERLASCSIVAGCVGILSSFLYIPFAVQFNSNYPGALICGSIGIVLAMLSKNASPNERKTYNKKAITGIILSCIAIGLTFFFFYSMLNYYDALKDPVLGPQINAVYERMRQHFEAVLSQGS